MKNKKEGNIGVQTLQVFKIRKVCTPMFPSFLFLVIFNFSRILDPCTQADSCTLSYKFKKYLIQIQPVFNFVGGKVHLALQGMSGHVRACIPIRGACSGV